MLEAKIGFFFMVISIWFITFIVKSIANNAKIQSRKNDWKNPYISSVNKEIQMLNQLASNSVTQKKEKDNPFIRKMTCEQLKSLSDSDLEDLSDNDLLYIKNMFENDNKKNTKQENSELTNFLNK